eukprot:917556-Ditylum_brightwellii.AAC.1
MVLAPLLQWDGSIDSDWWLDNKYCPSVKDIMVDMALKSVILVGKVIGYVYRGVYDAAFYKC